MFSKSKDFTASAPFSETKKFTKTGEFSKTIEFTETHDFSQSKKFTLSSSFSNSKFFTKSDHFTKTVEFTKTGQFTKTNEFTKTSAFSKSNNFKMSGIFSASFDFTSSTKFSNSDKFSKSDKFTRSNHFTVSQFFTYSKGFSESFSFTPSGSYHFTESSKFSETDAFTKSTCFTDSKSFFRYDPSVQSIKMSMEEVYITARSVSFSYSVVESNLVSCVFMSSGVCSYTIVRTDVFSFIPYIIYSMMPTYVPTQIVVEINTKKKWLTQEKLIGIVCGSASVFFFSIGIVLLAIQRERRRIDFINEEFDLSSSSDTEYESSSDQIKETKVIRNESTIPVGFVDDSWI